MELSLGIPLHSTLLVLCLYWKKKSLTGKSPKKIDFFFFFDLLNNIPECTGSAV